MTINNSTEHTEALEEIARLMYADPSPKSFDGNTLRILAKAVEEYENIHFPIGAPTPAEAAAFRAEQEQCPHDEHDHGICLDCGENIWDDVVAAAEFRADCNEDR